MARKLYSKEILQEAVLASDSMMDVIRFLGKATTGSRHNYITFLVKKYEIDTTHFTFNKNNNKTSRSKRRTAEDILVVRQGDMRAREESKLLARAMKEKGISYECKICSVSEWLGNPIVLDVDHIDGNPLDCRLENLRFLCPNCHRQTPTFGTRRDRQPKKFCDCGNPIQSRSKQCSICYANRKTV